MDYPRISCDQSVTLASLQVAKLESHLASKNPLEILVLRHEIFEFTKLDLKSFNFPVVTVVPVPRSQEESVMGPEPHYAPLCPGMPRYAPVQEATELEANWEDVATNIKQRLRGKGRSKTTWECWGVCDIM